jgi:hypothetical protein
MRLTFSRTARPSRKPERGRQAACFLIGLIFEPEDGSSTFLRNVSGFLITNPYIPEERRVYTVLHGPINLLALFYIPCLFTFSRFPNKRYRIPRLGFSGFASRALWHRNGAYHKVNSVSCENGLATLSRLADSRMFVSDSLPLGCQKMYLTSRHQHGARSFLYWR